MELDKLDAEIKKHIEDCLPEALYGEKVGREAVAYAVSSFFIHKAVTPGPEEWDGWLKQILELEREKRGKKV